MSGAAQPAVRPVTLDQDDIEAELAARMRRTRRPRRSPPAPWQAMSAISRLHENPRRRFDQALDALDKSRRDIGVDDAMIKRRRRRSSWCAAQTARPARPVG